MGYVPDWIRSTMCKTDVASKDGAKPATKFGIVSRELFHNAPVQKFADGGDVNVKGEAIGEYSGDDEIVKYRMNQIDDKGEDLRIPTSAKTTQSQMDVQDMENGSGSEMKSTPTTQAESQDKENGASQSYAKSSSVKSSTAKSSASKASASADPVVNDSPDYNIEPRDGRQRSVVLKDMTAPKEKPYIDIPKRAVGVQQYKSDAESPVESMFKKLTASQSQRTKAANKGK